MTHTTSFRLTAEHRMKLQQLADALGTNRNATMQQLIDNARIVPITRDEAVAILPGKTNRHDAKEFSGQSITAVSA